MNSYINDRSFTAKICSSWRYAVCFDTPPKGRMAGKTAAMIQGQISGTLKSTPTQQKTGKMGPPIAFATLIASCSDGQVQTVEVCAIGEVMAVLLRLQKGDSVAVSGPLSLVAFVDKHGKQQQRFSMVATQVTSQYSG